MVYKLFLNLKWWDCLKDGSSSNPCSETYHGAGPESEPETQNTANYFRSVMLSMF